MSDTLKVSISKTCEYCNGTGGKSRVPGPINYDIQEILDQSHKGAIIDVEKIKKHLDTLPKEVPGFTDQNVFIICQFCNGNGTRKTSVTIDELKNLIK